MSDRTQTSPPAPADDTRSDAPPAGGSTAEDRINRLMAKVNADDTAPASPPGPPPVGLPGFDILDTLGRGGMGVVYRARQTDLGGRVVAVKMILSGAHASDAELARFEAEAAAVAAVRHPNVVPVYHAGRHAGVPYFAMEYVPGGTLADRLAAGPLPPADAARAAEAVARGIAAAHAAGVLHRDLKPANVLLAADGTPRVTDFGLAKRLDVSDGPTATGAVMGTPSYMAPEQARGEPATVATDVYGLAAVLYAALTGRPPFQGPSTVDTLRQVTDREPVAVRQLQPDCPRDLETVALKGLAKEPARRYATAGDLADDLRRWLAGEPIAARPAGSVERSVKWVRRNRTASVAAAAVFAALAAGTGVSLWQAGVARTEAANARAAERTARDEGAKAIEREAAEKAARTSAEAVTRFMQEVFTLSSADGQLAVRRAADPNLTVRAAMDHAATVIADRFAGQPQAEADVRTAIGLAYVSLAAHAKAVEHLRRAYDLRRQTAGPDHPGTLTAAVTLGIQLHTVGRSAEAEPILRDALAAARRVGGPAAAEAEASALGGLGNLAHAARRHDEAVGYFRESLAVLRRHLPGDHANAVRETMNLAAALSGAGHDAEAERLYRDGLAAARRLHGDPHPETLNYIASVGCFLHTRGRAAEAERLLKESADAHLTIVGFAHPEAFAGIDALLMIYYGEGRTADAERLLADAADGCRKWLGPAHERTLKYVSDRATLYTRRRAFADAVPLYREVLAAYESTPGRADYITNAGISRVNLGTALLGAGDPAAAEPFLRAGYDWLSRQDARTEPRYRTQQRAVARQMARVCAESGRPLEAKVWDNRGRGLPDREEAPRPRPGG